MWVSAYLSFMQYVNLIVRNTSSPIRRRSLSSLGISPSRWCDLFHLFNSSNRLHDSPTVLKVGTFERRHGNFSALNLPRLTVAYVPVIATRSLCRAGLLFLRRRDIDGMVSVWRDEQVFGVRKSGDGFDAPDPSLAFARASRHNDFYSSTS